MVLDLSLHILSVAGLSKQDKREDFELVKLVQQGNQQSFRLLVEKYQDVSFTLACSILRNDQDAEDALQEAFIKAFRSIGKFRFESAFSTWLYKIVVNACMNTRNKKWAENETISESHLILHTETGHEKLSDSERSRIVHQVLEHLKINEALLLRLYYLSELSIQEIKIITGFKESKIKVTLMRARKHFGDAMRKAYGHEFEY